MDSQGGQGPRSPGTRADDGDPVLRHVFGEPIDFLFAIAIGRDDNRPHERLSLDAASLTQDGGLPFFEQAIDVRSHGSWPCSFDVIPGG